MRNITIFAIIAMAAMITFSPITAIGESDHYQILTSLPFSNGYPTEQTSHALNEELFFQRAVQTYLWALPAVNMFAMKEEKNKKFGKGYNIIASYEKR